MEMVILTYGTYEEMERVSYGTYKEMRGWASLWYIQRSVLNIQAPSLSSLISKTPQAPD